MGSRKFLECVGREIGLQSVCHSGFEQVTSFLRLSFLTCTMGLKRALTSQVHHIDGWRCCMSRAEPSAWNVVSSGCWELGYHRACRIPQLKAS